MRYVMITSGTYGHRPKDAKFITPVKAGERLELPDAEAARLVSLGVAAYTTPSCEEAPLTPVAMPHVGDNGGWVGEDQPPLVNGAEARETDNSGDNGKDEEGRPVYPAYNVDMKADQLRDLLKQFGLSLKAGMSKADMVATLDEYFASESEDSEAPPTFDVEEPVK